MEDSSHELIDQLLAEEKYCYGFESMPSAPASMSTRIPASVSSAPSAPLEDTMNNTSLESTVKPITLNTVQNMIEQSSDLGEKQASSVSSLVIQSHNKRWSAEEDEILAHCVKLYGYGKWKMISEHIKTRNALQCKNRARQKRELREFNQNKRKASSASIEETSPETKVSSGETSPQTSLIPIPSLLDNKEIENEESIPPMPLMEKNEPVSHEEHKPLLNEETVEETILHPEETTEEERSVNYEWFMGKPVKTPERYIRIRNHIIQSWYSSKPNYLTKTAGRKNLKDCGDVNAVGRIHTYLENIGAINVNCSVPPKRGQRRSSDSSAEKRESKKAKKGPSYFWADVEESDEEINEKHPRKNIIPSDGKSRPKRTANKRESFYDENRIDYGMSDDPFRLIPVVYYPKQHHAPFSVQVTSDVLLVMEFHSHLAYTEIIGLLGGRFVTDEEGKHVLRVEYVFPCRSASTGIQCEMDPVSEMAAREVFEQKGLQVVGWYHSHPTFDPEPSIRDIENQSSYQDLFRDETSGLEPFIGIIITPYNSGDVSERSQFQFIHISNRWNTNHQYRLPFACVHSVLQRQIVSSDVMQIFNDLLIQYKTYEHKIDLTLSYGSMTRLEKLLRSIKNHLFMGSEENKRFLIQVNQMIQDIYIGKPFRPEINQDYQNVDSVVHSLAI